MPLTHPVGEDAARPSKSMSLARRILVIVLKGIAGIAAAVAIFCPLSTFTEISVFGVSVVLALICYFILTNLDETHIEEYVKDGYWPKPLDWNRPPETRSSGEEGTVRD